MIDISKIRSIKVLEEMKKDLEFFITDPIVKDIYVNDMKCEEEDFLADKDDSEFLLDKINAKIKTLSKPTQSKKKSGKRGKQKSETKETSCSTQSTEVRDCDPCTSPDSGSSSDSQ